MPNAAETVAKMTPAQLVIANKKLLKTLAQRIAVGVVVTVSVSLISSALLNVISDASNEGTDPTE